MEISKIKQVKEKQEKKNKTKEFKFSEGHVIHKFI